MRIARGQIMAQTFAGRLSLRSTGAMVLGAALLLSPVLLASASAQVLGYASTPQSAFPSDNMNLDEGDGSGAMPERLKRTTVAFLGLSEVDLGVFRGKGQNMYTAVPSVATSDDPAIKAFVAAVRAEGGTDVVVSNYVMTHYNTLIALKGAIEKAGKVDKEAIIDAMTGSVKPSTQTLVRLPSPRSAPRKGSRA